MIFEVSKTNVFGLLILGDFCCCRYDKWSGNETIFHFNDNSCVHGCADGFPLLISSSTVQPPFICSVYLYIHSLLCGDQFLFNHSKQDLELIYAASSQRQFFFCVACQPMMMEVTHSDG